MRPADRAVSGRHRRTGGGTAERGGRRDRPVRGAYGSGTAPGFRATLWDGARGSPACEDAPQRRGGTGSRSRGRCRAHLGRMFQVAVWERGRLARCPRSRETGLETGVRTSLHARMLRRAAGEPPALREAFCEAGRPFSARSWRGKGRAWRLLTSESPGDSRHSCPPSCAVASTAAPAADVLRQRLANRADDFLRILRDAVYADPASPYAVLLRHAGCAYGDLDGWSADDGVEGALQVLYRNGVYLTGNELKGRQPARRGSATFDGSRAPAQPALGLPRSGAHRRQPRAGPADPRGPCRARATWR